VIIHSELRSLGRGVLLLFGFAGFGLLVSLAVSQYVIAKLTDGTSTPDRPGLLQAEKYLPASFPVQTSLARVETGRNLSDAESHALRATDLSPNNYGAWLLLGSIKEKQGDTHAAEQSLRKAISLAPNYSQTHWALAEFFASQRRTSEAAAEFRRATAKDQNSLSSALEVVWEISQGDINTLKAATNEDPGSQLILASFLVSRAHASDAVRVVSQIKDKKFLDSPAGAVFLNNLMTAGPVELAYMLWAQLVGNREIPSVWNGGFELEPQPQLSQFDWKIESSQSVPIAIESGTAHAGTQSLRIDFVGREAVNLNNEITQLIVLHAGTRYHLQCFVKTGRLSGLGPRVVVASVTPSDYLGASSPIPQGTNDWQPLSFDFSIPRSGSAETMPILISIKRNPAPGDNSPAQGTVWFDDFKLTELPEKK
jgi:Tetratricopeptide repeat